MTGPLLALLGMGLLLLGLLGCRWTAGRRAKAGAVLELAAGIALVLAGRLLGAPA